MENSSSNKKTKFSLGGRNYILLLNSAMYIFILLIITVIIIIEPSFLSFRNFNFILTQASISVIIALGEAGIIVAGGVDLSAGRMLALAAIICATLLQSPTASERVFPNLPVLPLILPLLLVIVINIIISALHGFIFAKFKIDPFITSLGVAYIVYGGLSLYFDGVAHSAPIGALDKKFTNVVSSSVKIGSFQLSYLVFYAVIFAVVIWFIWNKTTLGKNLYAIGGNPSAARVSGVNVIKNIIIAYVIGGILYACAGFLLAAYTGSVDNSMGTNYELDAIAACVVGGVSLKGGVGSVPGVIIGVMLFQVINYGLVYIGVNPYIQFVVKGLIIVIAVIIDTQKYIERN
jgi:methyl-galactoside transport system permease protein